MNHREKCDWPGCTNDAGPSHFIHGFAYCPEHYGLALEKHFLEEWKKVRYGLKKNKRFLNLFSRYVESLYNNNIPGGLAKGKLQERTYDLRKYGGKLYFRIQRHPGAFGPGRSQLVVEQRWVFDMKKKEMVLLSERELGYTSKDLSNF